MFTAYFLSISEMKITFVTFGDGSEDLKAAARRLGGQAYEAGWFDIIRTYSSDDLRKIDLNWFARNKGFLSKNKRGFGYWIWKPKIIYEELSRLGDGDILVYADAGYEISRFAKKRFTEYVSLAKLKGVLTFSLGHEIGAWTKGDTLARFGVHADSEDCGLSQSHAGLIIISRNRLTMQFFYAFDQICNEDDYRYITDAPSSISNCRNFIEHRHDQAVFSLLLLKLDVGWPIPVEDYTPHLWKDGVFDVRLPFHAIRNRTGIRLLSSEFR